MFIDIRFPKDIIYETTVHHRFDTNIAIDFNLQNLVQGWRILMPYVSEGGKIMMFIPSKYGYGANGSGDGTIPGNATLIFEVRLNSIK